MWRGGIEDSWMYFSLETSGQKEVHLKQSKGRCFFHIFFNIQHVVKPGHALCGGSINWFPKGSEKLMEDIILVTIKYDSLGCSSSSGSPMVFRAWTTCFLYSFHQHLAHRILGQMEAGSGVLVCHKTQEQLPTCWPTGLLQNSSCSLLQSHTKGVCSTTLVFSPLLGGIHFIWLYMQTSCTINTATTGLDPLLSLWREKHFQGKMHPPPEVATSAAPTELHPKRAYFSPLTTNNSRQAALI